MNKEEKRKRWERVRALSLALISELGTFGEADETAKSMQTGASYFAVAADLQMAVLEHDEELPTGN